jgi:hypothetical protein
MRQGEKDVTYSLRMVCTHAHPAAGLGLRYLCEPLTIREKCVSTLRRALFRFHLAATELSQDVTIDLMNSFLDKLLCRTACSLVEQRSIEGDVARR